MNTSPDLLAQYIPLATVILISIGSVLYFRWLYNRFSDLQDSGIAVNATALKCRPYSTRGGRILRVEYEFRTSAGEERQGRSDLTYSEESEKEYSVGKTFSVLYSPSGTNTATYPVKNLPDALKGMKRLNKIMPIVLLGNLLMFYYILFYLHKPPV